MPNSEMAPEKKILSSDQINFLKETVLEIMKDLQQNTDLKIEHISNETSLSDLKWDELDIIEFVLRVEPRLKKEFQYDGATIEVSEKEITTFGDLIKQIEDSLNGIAPLNKSTDGISNDNSENFLTSFINAFKEKINKFYT
ncbi:hypothetical protein K9L27_04700 [Candidatus Gracilibacteria bacterium]|nr:hypothetical protein [Candidatus Gracilibacteria bacterium]